jgi:paired amphipathic helix protein Sin3a
VTLLLPIFPSPLFGSNPFGCSAIFFNIEMPNDQVADISQRAKISHTKTMQADAPNISPSLVPQLPEPIPPQSSLSVTQDELGFFDRAKKFISNKNSYTEFLKLINLFSQDLIDKNTLADRISAFIGGNPDLMSFFNRMISVEASEEIIEARAKPDPGRVNLSHCRSLGPSYRHLPKREQHKICRGRDEMCHEVLNDEWASHPTWASEDSGFVAHRKNQYEDGLHRLEEERHDYDFHIESCQRTIQLMEPILQQMRLLNDNDRARFVIDEKLGGHSKAIPTRIINKVYGSQVGKTVMAQLIARPAAVLPIVLTRLKQKLEEWKQSQREWEKVWREQTHKFFWKSLDHQGINAKNLDKKNFQQKTLTSEIQAKYDERKKIREAGYQQVAHQFEYAFTQQEVLLDASHLILFALEKDRATFNSGEQERISAFLTRFVSTFFGVDTTVFKEFMLDIQEHASNGDMDDETNGEEAIQQRFLKANMRKADILHRLALNKHAGKEGSILTGSKESTPAGGAMSEIEQDDDPITEPDVVADVAARRWMDHPAIAHGGKMRRYLLDEPYERDEFNLYANANIYCFFRLFETLYSRLVAIKEHEEGVHEDVRRAMGEKGQPPRAAISLRMIDKLPSDFFVDVGPKASYYRQIIAMCEEVLSGSLDVSHLEDTLRRFYMKNGWQLYTFDRLLAAINRFIMNMLSADSKDKSTDIINLFYKDRERGETTRTQERFYRKQVQKLVKEGEVYRIRYVSCSTEHERYDIDWLQNPKTTRATIRLFPSDDDTFSGERLDDEARWSVYVTSYQMLDPTEGVPHSRVGKPFLKRNLVKHVDVDSILSEDRQDLRVDVTTYRIIFTYNGVPGKPFVYEKKVSKNEMAFAEEALAKAKTRRDDKMWEKFVDHTEWMKGLNADEVERRNLAWRTGLDEGLWKMEESLIQEIPANAPASADAMAVDARV